MRIIGFNFTKVLAERPEEYSKGSEISTNVEFKDIKKEETDFAKDSNEAIKVLFDFKVDYLKKENKKATNAQVVLSGFLVLLTSKDEAKTLLKDWESRQVSPSFQVPIFNFLLGRCSIRALQLEEELNLPLHIPMPKLKAESASAKADKAKK